MPIFRGAIGHILKIWPASYQTVLRRFFEFLEALWIIYLEWDLLVDVSKVGQIRDVVTQR